MKLIDLLNILDSGCKIRVRELCTTEPFFDGYAEDLKETNSPYLNYEVADGVYYSKLYDALEIDILHL